MKKYLHIALMLLCVFVVSSCKDDGDDTEAVEREAYKLEQDIAFQAKVNETGFENGIRKPVMAMFCQTD